MVLRCPVVFGIVFIAVSINFVVCQRNDVSEKVTSYLDDLEDRSNLHPTYICKVCSCMYKSQILECGQRDKDSHFRNADWIILKTADFNITIANFSGNRIETVLPFPEIELKTLDLSHNGIHQIANYAFENLKQMETLDLSYNQLQSLNAEVFQGQKSNLSFASLKTLLLGNNFLTTLQEDIFQNMLHLKELKLNNNPLKSVSWNDAYLYYFQISLMHLDLSYTQTSDLSKITFITGFNTLNTLNLKGNLFTAIPYELNNVKELEVLILDDNPIETLGSGSFPLMKSLKELHMSSMSRLTSIERYAIYNLTALEKLYLTNNLLLSRINQLGLEQSGMHSLKELYLRNSNLKTLNSYTVQNWNQLTKLDLRENPWTCYCEDRWLTDPVMLSIYEADPTIATDILCYEPAEMMGQNIQTILNDDYNDYERSCIKMMTDGQTNIEELTDDEDEYKYVDTNENNTVLIVLLLGCSIASPIMLALFVMYKRGCLNFSNRSRTPSEYSEYLYKKTDAKDDDMSD